MSLPEPLEPTRSRTLVWAGLVGAALTYATLATVDAFDIIAPEVPITVPVLLLAAAVGGAGLARVTWLRNRAPGHRTDVKQAVATLALARAMMLAGSAFTGGYLAFALYFLPRWDAPSPRMRVVVGLVSMATSVALIAAGRFLESACRVPKQDDEKGPSDTDA